MNAEDKELLEQAAKAAGIEVTDGMRGLWEFEGSSAWNPLADDGEALRLVVKLRLQIQVNAQSVVVSPFQQDSGESGPDTYEYFHYKHENDGNPEKATRRAIVRAAAEIGSAMPHNVEVTRRHAKENE